MRFLRINIPALKKRDDYSIKAIVMPQTDTICCQHSSERYCSQPCPNDRSARLTIRFTNFPLETNGFQKQLPGHTQFARLYFYGQQMLNRKVVNLG